jgi:hypothetical protein
MKVFNWIQEWQSRSTLRRRLASLNECTACGHNWGEPGFDNDVDGMCGECAYEIEHQLRSPEKPGCRLHRDPLPP